MKRFLKSMLAIVLVFALTFQMVAITEPIEANAATVSLNKTWKTIIMGNTYTFWVKNATDVKSKAWSSTKTAIATVNGKGTVTPVAAGKTTIKCTITYTDGTTEVVKAVVAVKERVAATAVTISNKETGDSNAQTIEVGSSVTFTSTKTPSTTTDYVYYTIADEEYATVTSAGVVTGVKAGVTVLEARVGANATDAKASTNTVVDRVYLNVVEATATPTPTPTSPCVEGITLVGSKEIQIEFNSEILESSVIDSSGDLISGTVIVGLGTDATDVSTLVPELSDDGKTLSLTTEASFDGTYVITVSKSITTVDGTAMTPYTIQEEFEDNIGPILQGSAVDDSGYICTFTFNEQINISDMTVTSVTSDDTTLKALLADASNYTLSSDKKSMSIDLSGSGISDEKVTAAVKFSGITDLADNVSYSNPLTATAIVDATTQDLATISSIKRVSKTTLQITFNKPMYYGGYVIVDDETINGVISASDNTIVNYTLPDTSLTGNITVQISGWYNYRASEYQDDIVKRTISFTIDTTAPAASSYTLVNTTKNSTAITKMTVTYSKDISVVDASGTMTAKVQNTSGNVYSSTLTYTATASDNVLTVVFATSQATDSGTYTITIPEGIVMDDYGNLSEEESLTMTKELDSSCALPAPSAVTQDSSDSSIVYVYFSAKIDLTTATDVNNYVFASSIYPESATVISQDDSSATVQLTFASGALSYDGTYKVVISGIKGYNDSYAEMDTYKSTISLTGNVAATIDTAYLTSSSFAVLTLTESVTGSATVQVYNKGSYITADCTVDGDTLYISFDSEISGSTAYVIFTANSLYDSDGNKASITLNSKIKLTKTY